MVDVTSRRLFHWVQLDESASFVKVYARGGKGIPRHDLCIPITEEMHLRIAMAGLRREDGIPRWRYHRYVGTFRLEDTGG